MKRELKINCGDLDAFNWYITPEKPCCYQDTHKESGEFTGLILGQALDSRPHNQYQSIQLYKTHQKMRSIELDFDIFVADFDFSPAGKWLTIAAISTDERDDPAYTLTVNVEKTAEGYRLCLYHVPWMFTEEYDYRDFGTLFPFDQWVRIKVQCDMIDRRCVRLWQGGKIIAESKINHTKAEISQLHLGLYASPYFNSGLVRNKNLRIKEWHA